ncbi:hypothetical protein BM527_04840 [Alteromonas sp. Mex14]|nr:hypothetical protein BM527_04840 [Alteromonas sp. Mex14]
MEKNFLLGLGCQKGGSTWLYNYLKAHPNVNMGFTKEYHFFDAVLGGKKEVLIEAAREKSSNFMNVHKNVSENCDFNLDLINFYQNPRAYFEYFDGLFKRDKNVNVAGDLTPEYALLSESDFRQIKQMFADFGFNLQILFVMREPVERIWSAVRMHRKIYPHQFSPTDTRTDEELVASRYKRSDIEARTRYEKTIRTIEKVFEPSQIHYEFFERLHTPAAMTKICDFLNVPFQPPKFAEKINGQEKTGRLSDKVRETIVDYYSNTYNFVFDKFSGEKIDEIW